MRFSITVLPALAAVAAAFPQPVRVAPISKPTHNTTLDEQIWDAMWQKLLAESPEIKWHEIVQATEDLAAATMERLRELTLASCEPPFVSPVDEAKSKPKCYETNYPIFQMLLNELTLNNALGNGTHPNGTVHVRTNTQRHA